MSGIGGSEFLLLCVIGLLILGPERLPRVARQIGGWVGKARQMTRSLQRQLEEEVDIKKNFGIDPAELNPDALLTPRDDDTYSPLHSDDDDDGIGDGDSNGDDRQEDDEPPVTDQDAGEETVEEKTA